MAAPLRFRSSPGTYVSSVLPGLKPSLRLNLYPYLMPKNKDGVVFNPTELNRSDGFSPGSTLLTYVP